MSRAQDLKEVESQIGDLEKELQQAADDFKTYNDEVTATTRAVMEEAGVYEEIHGLEVERAEAQQRLQAKVNRLQQDLAGKRAVKEFLVGRENLDKRRKEKEEDDKASKASTASKKSRKKKRPTPPA